MEFLKALFSSLLVTASPAFEDVSTSHLPLADLAQLSMDAASADFDGDGDRDIIIANEHRPNIFLVNDGSGRFSNQSQRIPQVAHDSEDIGVADFDGDGDLDIVVVSEDDQVNELYLNRGDGSFDDGGNRLPVSGTSNAVLLLDVNGDSAMDILIGNNGQNVLLVNDGRGFFQDQTQQRLPARADVTQGLAAGDLNGDGHLDLVFANEGDNRLLFNNGQGVFRDAGEERLPLRQSAEESREVALGDFDGDGDLDLFFANVQAFVAGASRQNRLLLNDGTGAFSDASERLPADDDRSFTAAVLDIDGDGDIDILTGNTNGPGFDAETPFRVYLNDGRAGFVEATSKLFPASASGRGFDIEIADFNGDGRADLYLASRGSADRLLFRLR